MVGVGDDIERHGVAAVLESLPHAPRTVREPGVEVEIAPVDPLAGLLGRHQHRVGDEPLAGLDPFERQILNAGRSEAESRGRRHTSAGKGEPVGEVGLGLSRPETELAVERLKPFTLVPRLRAQLDRLAHPDRRGQHGMDPVELLPTVREQRPDRGALTSEHPERLGGFDQRAGRRRQRHSTPRTAGRLYASPRRGGGRRRLPPGQRQRSRMAEKNGKERMEAGQTGDCWLLSVAELSLFSENHTTRTVDPFSPYS